MPIWTFVLPIVAVAVCFAARARIRKSEGALTGSRLATWGVGLTVVVGLLYAAYYAGCYFAVSSQAEKFGNEWMDLLRTGKPDKIDQAFLYTQQPPRPADDDHLRDRLEMDFDRGQSGHGGMLTGFRQCELVRQFEQGGATPRSSSSASSAGATIRSRATRSLSTTGSPRPRWFPRSSPPPPEGMTRTAIGNGS